MEESDVNKMINYFSSKNLEVIIKERLNRHPSDWSFYPYLSIQEFENLSKMEQNNIIKMIIESESEYKIHVLRAMLYKTHHLINLTDNIIDKLIKQHVFVLYLLSNDILNKLRIIKITSDEELGGRSSFIMSGSTFNELYSEMHFNKQLKGDHKKEGYVLYGGEMHITKKEKKNIKLYKHMTNKHLRKVEMSKDAKILIEQNYIKINNSY